MTKYVFQSGSVLESLQIVRNDMGGMRGYIKAAPNATPEQLHEVEATLKAQHLSCVPTLKDGEPMLEVRGFKRPSFAIKPLIESGYVGGVDRAENDAGGRISSASKLRAATLTLAGISYNIGDGGYMTYAFKKNNMEKVKGAGLKHPTNFFNMLDIVAGLGYAAGSFVLTFFGHGDRSQILIQDTSKRIKNYLGDAGVITAPDSTLSNTAYEKKQEGIFGRIGDTMRKFPSEVFNGIYIFVGVFLGAAAFYRTVAAHAAGNKKLMKEEALDVGLGAMTFASALTGLAVKERKIAPEDRRHGLGRVIDWIQEKPLRAVGFGYAVSTGFHGFSTYKKYKGGDAVARKTIIGRGIFVAMNVVSELLLFVSSKGHGEGIKPDKSVDETIIAAAADTIRRQPESKRETLTAQLAGYMASPEMLGGDVGEITTALKQHVTALERNPWSHAHYNAKSAPAQAMPAPAIAKATAPSTSISAPEHKARVTEALTPAHAV